ncbi:AraC family transcriptional regulator [Streptomyces beihaiensis]|uniref:AraC family transcriptional regulator n=1 Tax=Streptomyces beihaiensis TaxID=2984495 RepID=A0ABT3TRQ9_9ACTN|nr:AraC family transcriptional regulator [Streptomyces beihaiensis]MCX3059706.1 AraC family transcriptional regulator [Streptomyces beihaiensis]
MDTSQRTIGVRHVRALLGGARGRGLDTAALLHAARIPPLLTADPRARVTERQFAALFRRLYAATQDEFLGLGAAVSRPGTFAMMCRASLGCPDLGAAVRRGAEFYGLFPGGPELALEPAESDTDAALYVRGARPPSGGGDPYLTECVLAIWHRLCGWLIGHRIPLTGVDFAFPAPRPGEERLAEHRELFGCDVEFGAPHSRARFGRRWLAAPLVRDEPALDAMLRRAPVELLARRPYATTTAEHVRAALAAALRSGARLPALTELADRLAVSTATLRRRLAVEATSYRAVRDDVLREAALASLADGRASVESVARRLGFAEDTSFHRAFVRWTGTTPGAYRRAAVTGR